MMDLNACFDWGARDLPGRGSGNGEGENQERPHPLHTHRVNHWLRQPGVKMRLRLFLGFVAWWPSMERREMRNRKALEDRRTDGGMAALTQIEKTVESSQEEVLEVIQEENSGGKGGGVVGRHWHVGRRHRERAEGMSQGSSSSDPGATLGQRGSPAGAHGRMERSGDELPAERDHGVYRYPGAERGAVGVAPGQWWDTVAASESGEWKSQRWRPA